MNYIIQTSAEEDILRQFDWYVERGLIDVARRFRIATHEAINALAAMPGAGAPKRIGNSQLSGLRTWSIKGFDEFRVYYLPQPALVKIIRILHGKRDIGALLEEQDVEDSSLH